MANRLFEVFPGALFFTQIQITKANRVVDNRGKGLDFKVLNLVSSDLLTLDGRVLDRVRFEIEEVQGVEIKRLIRTWWFDITAPWHKDERYNPIVE